MISKNNIKIKKEENDKQIKQTQTVEEQQRKICNKSIKTTALLFIYNFLEFKCVHMLVGYVAHTAIQFKIAWRMTNKGKAKSGIAFYHYWLEAVSI